jgi:hypothetical protein
MCGVRFASVLACCCISAGVAGAGAEAAQDDPASLELALARRPALYLVIGRDGRWLSVRVRGLELDSVPLSGVRVARQGVGVGPDELAELSSPQVWRVTEAPAENWRRVVAPEVLVPFTDDEDQPEPAAGIAPSPTPPPPRPDRYTVTTDSGWRLAVAPSVEGAAPVGWWRRVVRGWRRIVGDPEPALPPTLVVIVADPDDARRLVHLFSPGTAVLLGGDEAVASGLPGS